MKEKCDAKTCGGCQKFHVQKRGSTILCSTLLAGGQIIISEKEESPCQWRKPRNQWCGHTTQKPQIGKVPATPKGGSQLAHEKKTDKMKQDYNVELTKVEAKYKAHLFAVEAKHRANERCHEQVNVVKQKWAVIISEKEFERDEVREELCIRICTLLARKSSLKLMKVWNWMDLMKAPSVWHVRVWRNAQLVLGKRLTWRISPHVVRRTSTLPNAWRMKDGQISIKIFASILLCGNERLVLDAENFISRSVSHLFVQRSGGMKFAGVEEDIVVWNFETVFKTADFLLSCGIDSVRRPLCSNIIILVWPFPSPWMV
jgi:hypothetical protein